MVKSYLRYRFTQDFGVVASQESNVLFDHTGRHIYSGVNEFLYKWNPRSSEIDLKLFLENESSSLSYVTQLALHPTQNLVAVGYSNGTIRLWDITSRSLIITFHGHKSGISVLRFSLDGQLLVSGGWDTDIVVWDTVSQAGLFRLRGHQNRVTDICFVYPKNIQQISPKEEVDIDNGGKGSHRNKKKRQKKEVEESLDQDNSYEDLNNNIKQCFFELSRSASLIISSSTDGTIKFWDIATQWCVQTIFNPSGDVWSLMIDPIQSRLFIGSNDHLIKVYQLHLSNNLEAGDTGKNNENIIATHIGSISRPEHRGRAAFFLSIVDSSAVLKDLTSLPALTVNDDLTKEEEDTMLTSIETISSKRKITSIGSVMTGEHTHTVNTRLRRLLFLISPNNRAIEVYRVYPNDEQLLKFEKRKRRAQEKLKKKKTNLLDLQAKFASLEKQLQEGHKRTSIGTTFEAEKDTVIARLELLTEEMELLKSDGSQQQPQASDGLDYLHTFFLPHKPVSVDYYPMNSTLAVCYGDNTIQILKVPIDILMTMKKHSKPSEDETEHLEKELQLIENCSINSVGHSSPPQSICISHDDSMIASLANKTLHLWRTDTVKHIRNIDVPEHVTSGFFVAGNQHFLLGSNKGTLYLIDITACVIIQTYENAHAASIKAIAEHPKKTGFISAGNDKRFHVFQFYVSEITENEDVIANNTSELVQFKSLMTFDVMDEPQDIQYSADGRFIIASLLDFTIQVFYADTMKLFLTLYGHKLPCPSIAISSDCTVLASGSNDKTIKIWGLDFGNIQKSWHAHDEGVTKVMFLKDTHYLASTGKDALLKLWDVDRRDLICCFSGHIKSITCLAATRLDADRILTGGLDGSIRVWERTDEQLFPDEEKEKLLELMMDKEAARSDFCVPGGQVVASTRATRKTIESVKSTEQLMEAVEHAWKALEEQRNYLEALKTWEESCQRKKVHENNINSLESLPDISRPVAPEPPHQLMGLSAHHFIFITLTKLSSALSYEVVIGLPFSFAEKLLNIISDLLATMDAATADSAGTHALEPVARIALLTVHIHMRQFLTSPKYREMLLKLHTFLRPILAREKERMEFIQRSVALLQKKAIEDSTVIAAL